MAGTNDFLPWATSGGANVESQAAYVVDPAVPIGVAHGTALSALANKVWRQASIAAYCIGQLIVDVLGVNAADDGDTATLLANLKLAIVGLVWNPGDGRITFRMTAASGWIILDDGSIGNGSSGGTTRANADCANAFAALWNGVSNSFAQVQDSSGNPVSRGASAALDFAANRRIVVPKQLGRAIAVAGTGAGLSPRSLGQFLGEETHLQLLAEMAAHTHNYTIVAGGGSIQAGGGFVLATGTTTSSGSSTPFNVMQPTSFWKVEMKL